ncbi:MAG: hypothetical protein ACLP9L_21780 [Thermoguttaceae bacterium]
MVGGVGLGVQENGWGYQMDGPAPLPGRPNTLDSKVRTVDKDEVKYRIRRIEALVAKFDDAERFRQTPSNDCPKSDVVP